MCDKTIQYLSYGKKKVEWVKIEAAWSETTINAIVCFDALLVDLPLTFLLRKLPVATLFEKKSKKKSLRLEITIAIKLNVENKTHLVRTKRLVRWMAL